MKNKIVFLDFDGVLNSEKYVHTCGYFGVILDPTRMRLLKQIIDSTAAKIVLSTSWREHWSTNKQDCNDTGVIINEIFQKHGLYIFDKTPQTRLGREQEINMWLEKHKDIENFVVLDDAFLSADYLNGHFVKTSNYRDGLDEQNVAEAIEILNG